MGAEGVTLPPAPLEQEGFSARRVARTALALLAIATIGALILRKSFPAAASLTVAGGVAIINFRSLEGLLQRVLQPGRPRFDRRSLLTIAGRFALLAGGFAALLLVPGVDFVAVAVGFSTLVVALVIEGLRWGAVGGG
jgi:hypothetical protein